MNTVGQAQIFSNICKTWTFQTKINSFAITLDNKFHILSAPQANNVLRMLSTMLIPILKFNLLHHVTM